ncbi:MAG: gamma-glutamyltransferase family protein [Alphaproteobacteria bacterium]
MLQTPKATRGIVVAPHHLASQAGLRVLREGGNAIEAMVAAAATVTVVYPHMNALGGDNFWLLSDGRDTPVGIDACGAAAAAADVDLYRRQGLDAIPSRGPLAANTIAGAVSGWQRALEVSARWGGGLSLSRLLEDAIHYAREGVPVTGAQHADTVAKRAELAEVPGFAETFLVAGEVPPVGALFKQPALARTLEALAKAGFDDFYRGDVARAIAAELERVGSPVSAEDLARHHSREVAPLKVTLQSGTVYNLPPPTQGLTSLMTLALFERLGCWEPEGFDHIHGLIEATKCAFKVRDAHVTDPAYMDVDPASFLTDAALDDMVVAIDSAKAAPWLPGESAGNTVWLGAIDGAGCAVSFIQSLYWEFGSGVVLRDTGITWQNRGVSFSLAEGAVNVLKPGRKPFHTIQPPLALLGDGRVMAYGTMGGEGQPQTQAAIFTRHVTFGQQLQAAVTAPRWLLGRTWGARTAYLRLENRFAAEVVDALIEAGHDLELVGAFDPVMGHAGAVVRHPGGLIEGAADPRGDGVVAAF